MAKILIRHADVLNLDAENHALPDCEVAIDGASIVAVGVAPQGFEPDETVDASGRVVLPGFYNAHTHSALTLMRGWFDDLWAGRVVGEREIFDATGMTADDVYWGAALAVKESLRRGIVGFADRFFHMDRVLEVVQESGIRANLAWCMYGDPAGEVGTDVRGIVAFVERCLSEGSGRVIPSLGPHSASLCTPQFLARTSAVATRLGVGIHVQVAETEQQFDRVLADEDLTPVQLLDRNGVFDVPVLAVGAPRLTALDIEILQSKRPVLVVSPYSEARRRAPVVSVRRLLDLRVPVAIGTDAAVVRGRLDLLEDARLLVLVGESANPGAPQLDAATALRLATVAGAHALGFKLSGEILPGRNADLILVELMTPHAVPGRDLASAILHRVADDGVTDVMIAGRWIVRDRELQTMDGERIGREAEARSLRLARHLTT